MHHAQPASFPPSPSRPPPELGHWEASWVECIWCRATAGGRIGLQVRLESHNERNCGCWALKRIVFDSDDMLVRLPLVYYNKTHFSPELVWLDICSLHPEKALTKTGTYTVNGKGRFWTIAFLKIKPFHFFTIFFFKTENLALGDKTVSVLL